MSIRIASTIVSAAFVALALSGCGRGGSTQTGGTGGGRGGGTGGGGGSSLSISQVAPSTVMVGVPPELVLVSGTGFTENSQVLIDGQPAQSTIPDGPGVLQADVSDSLNSSVGTHQFSVQNGSQISNSLPYTVYAPQQGPFVMQAIPGFLVGENLSDAPFIVAADINGDGLADVIMPAYPDVNTGVFILYGQADGTLSAAQYVSAPTTPYALAVGDVDGNGTPDLVSITSDNGVNGSTTVSVLFGDGHGNFQPPVVQQTFPGIFPGPAQLVDLDGDGKPDLILAVQGASVSSTGGTVVWLKNTGGGFAPPVTLASYPGNFRDFAVADFQHDGKPDILYVAADLSFHMLLNQGGGQFHDQLAAGLSGAIGIPNVLDFNLDGIPDVVVEEQQVPGQLVSFAGKGDGSFTKVASVNTPGLAQLVSGDFDHDGFPDLAGPSGLEPSTITYFFGDGRGNFAAQAVVGPEGSVAAVGDFNGDGFPDIVIPDRFNFVSLSLGRTDRNFPSPVSLAPATMTNLSTGPITKGGLPAIFVGGDFIDNIPGTVFENLGNGSFQLAANTDPSSFLIADLTGKGVVDLLGGNTNLEIWPNNGTFNFSRSSITFQQPTGDVTVADMDGDGFPDIVSTTGQIFYGNGSYQFTPVAVGTISSPYVIGDFNGDGKLDIATGSAIFLNTGNRTFQQLPGSLPLDNGAIAVVGDFNGDGLDDVAINFSDQTVISIWYSKGDGTFYEGTVIDPGQLPGALAVGDFNGDGRTDLAVGLMLSQQACILFPLGNGQFSRSFFASGADAVAITTSDLNRDGKPDLVIGNFVLDFAPPNVDVVFHK